MLNDILKKAFLQPEEKEIIVKAEDLPVGGGVDFKLTYFEPQVGKDYTIKFIQNVEEGGENLTHRKVYKDLPDPTRKGKTFQYVSSGASATCKPLELFFELNTAKKAGDVVAADKIENFMGATNQGCCVIQIIDSPDKEEIGLYRLFTFSTYGANATVANLINEKQNPTAQQIKNGFAKENIFDLFDSPVLLLSCVESVYDGQKGRDFTKSSWGRLNRGAFVIDPETKAVHNFSKADIVNGDLTPEAEKAFLQVVAILQDPKISVHNYFSYKTIDDPKNTDDTKKYLENLHKKIDEIIPVIRNAKSVGEVKAYGKIDNSSPTNSDGAQIIGGGKASDILKDSVPSELAGSILNEAAETPAQNVETPSNGGQPSVDDILGS